jgi:SAM-dependent methyltransferase
MKRSVHISYEYQERERLYTAYMNLINYALSKSGKKRKDFRILDVGCGRGDFLGRLVREGYDALGLDFDQRCVQLASSVGEAVLGDINEANKILKGETFDLILLMHVLEHLKEPVKTINVIKELGGRWILIAVPNPIRPKILLKYALLGKDYSNKGHCYSWDRSHFSNFIVAQSESNCNSLQV